MVSISINERQQHCAEIETDLLRVDFFPYRLKVDRPSYLHLCASVTKQYNLVPAKGSDALRLGR